MSQRRSSSCKRFCAFWTYRNAIHHIRTDVDSGTTCFLPNVQKCEIKEQNIGLFIITYWDQNCSVMRPWSSTTAAPRPERLLWLRHRVRMCFQCVCIDNRHGFMHNWINYNYDCSDGRKLIVTVLCLGASLLVCVIQFYTLDKWQFNCSIQTVG